MNFVQSPDPISMNILQLSVMFYHGIKVCLEEGTPFHKNSVRKGLVNEKTELELEE